MVTSSDSDDSPMSSDSSNSNLGMSSDDDSYMVYLDKTEAETEKTLVVESSLRPSQEESVSVSDLNSYHNEVRTGTQQPTSSDSVSDNKRSLLSSTAKKYSSPNRGTFQFVSEKHYVVSRTWYKKYQNKARQFQKLKKNLTRK